MSRIPGASPLPPIVVSERDYEKLSELAAAAEQRMPEIAEALLAELERASVIRPEALPADSVRLGSRVAYQSDDAAVRRVTLVLPCDADISAGKVSILTPIGTALLGLRAGQSITWAARNGRQQRLQIVAVDQTAPVKA